MPKSQKLKPVFMMSQLSVAQFLKPGRLHFDLLLMDEASQIEPADALGAIARVKQIVVVGDERQFPPTRFFAKLTSDVDGRRRLSARRPGSAIAIAAPGSLLSWNLAAGGAAHNGRGCCAADACDYDRRPTLG
jgi:hypothetical protein